MNNNTRPLIPEPSAAPKLLSKSEVIERVGKSYPTIWAWMRDGLFPRSVVVGSQVAWYAHEIDEWFRTLPRQRLKGDPPAPAVEHVAKVTKEALRNARRIPKHKLRRKQREGER
jgi:predicted DNA-binding transcriptional regulator AlpA